MKINESSDYVKARALLLAEYFSQRGWLVTAGKNNCILIYVQNEEIYNFTADQLMETICESDWHIAGTGLKTSPVTYMFYHRGEFYKKFEVLSSSEYDIYDND